MEEKVKQIMSDIFDLHAGAINESTSTDNIASWDSLHHINLVLALEEDFGVSLDVDEIEAMVSFGDILKVLKGKL